MNNWTFGGPAFRHAGEAMKNFYVDKIIEHLDAVNEAMSANVTNGRWPTLTDDQKVQALLDAAAAINPAVQDVADTLVATINRVQGD